MTNSPKPPLRPRGNTPASPWAAGALIVTLALLAVCWPRFAGAASFQVSPTRFEFSLDKRFTNFFTITNNSESTLRIRIYPKFIEFGEGGKFMEKVGHIHDLSRWMVFNPRLVTIRTKQKRIIRFSVRPPKEIDTGEYRAVVFFEELPAEAKGSFKAGKTPGVTLDLKLLTRLGVTLYGLRGEAKIEAKFEPGEYVLTNNQLTYNAHFMNTGNIHLPVNIHAQLLNDAGDTLEEVTSVLVLQRGQRLSWQFLSKKIEIGALQLKIKASAKDFEFEEVMVPIQVNVSQGN